ncbi:MAG: alpha/beta hydrolase [Armatimonadota bacterium]
MSARKMFLFGWSKRLDPKAMRDILSTMKRHSILIAIALVCSTCFGQERISDQIYMKNGGAAFTLDVFKAAKPDAPCVIWICSGGWHSDHKDINPIIAKMFNDQGIAVVEVVHGSQPRFTLNEIVPQIKRAVRYVHANAARFGIDSNRIGISGASAGGHLSLMIGGTGDEGDTNAKDPVDKYPSSVNAVGAFMPPTDFLNWGKDAYIPFDNPAMAIYTPAFGVPKDAPKDRLAEVAKQFSPIVYVNPKFPPTMIIQGDKDALVPMQQAQIMDAALGKQGIDHSLVIVPGGGHDAKTLMEGFPKLINWYKSKFRL